jgi:hypothetical protein
MTRASGASTIRESPRRSPRGRPSRRISGMRVTAACDLFTVALDLVTVGRVTRWVC